MSNNKKLLIAAGAMALSIGASADGDQVKCYGVAPAGGNHCGFVNYMGEKHSCRGNSTLDCEWNAWMVVDSKEECDKMGGVVGEDAAKLASNVEGELLGEKDAKDRAVNHNCKLLKDRKMSGEKSMSEKSKPEKKNWFQKVFG
jgi:uncharacterized membrane protein